MPTESPADSILFLLRHLGPQSDRDLVDSLGLPAVRVCDTLSTLSLAGRIERHGGNRWRIVPSRPAPTGNPGTR